MDKRLTEFLMSYSGRPMQWGVDDCSLILADWWKLNHGTDPAAHLRGTYSTEVEKDQIVEKMGGVENLVNSIAQSVGAKKSAANEDGGFGVVSIIGIGHISAIRAGRFWACRSMNGIAFTSRAKLVSGWSI